MLIQPMESILNDTCNEVHQITLILFYKNHFYKNNEAQIAEKLRIS